MRVRQANDLVPLIKKIIREGIDEQYLFMAFELASGKTMHDMAASMRCPPGSGPGDGYDVMVSGIADRLFRDGVVARTFILESDVSDFVDD